MFSPRPEETGNGNKQLFHTDEHLACVNNCEVHCAPTQTVLKNTATACELEVDTSSVISLGVFFLMTKVLAGNCKPGPRSFPSFKSKTGALQQDVRTAPSVGPCERGSPPKSEPLSAGEAGADAPLHSDHCPAPPPSARDRDGVGVCVRESLCLQTCVRTWEDVQVCADA